MNLIAPDVWQLQGMPRDTFNIYLAGDVLIDAGTRWAWRRIFRQLQGRKLRLLALTHCHPDHQGTAHWLCQRWQIPLACHRADIPFMEGRERMVPANFWIRMGEWFWSGPSHPVGRPLEEGDQIGEFRVVHTPGHTPGHCLFFRDKDRLAIAGDLVANINFLTGKPGLREPPPFFTADPDLNRQSIKKLVELEPRLVCFGHGPPLRDCSWLPRLLERIEQRQARAKRFP